MRKFFGFFDFLLEKLSRWGIIISLMVILLLAVSAIVLRWMGMSPSWIDPLVRHLVFLSAFLGGSLATSKRVHIKIDVLTHLIERAKSPRLKWLHQNLVSLFCFVTTVMLAYSAYEFFKVEQEFGGESFLGIHSAALVAIIPCGMGLIALRFFNQMIIGTWGEEVYASPDL